MELVPYRCETLRASKVVVIESGWLGLLAVGKLLTGRVFGPGQGHRASLLGPATRKCFSFGLLSWNQDPIPRFDNVRRFGVYRNHCHHRGWPRVPRASYRLGLVLLQEARRSETSEAAPWCNWVVLWTTDSSRIRYVCTLVESNGMCNSLAIFTTSK